jgi:hypothetical protein
MIKVIHDVSTGEITEIDFTEQEIKAVNKDKVEAAKTAKDGAAKATAKQVILDKLGITEEEAATLLG